MVQAQEKDKHCIGDALIAIGWLIQKWRGVQGVTCDLIEELSIIARRPARIMHREARPDMDITENIVMMKQCYGYKKYYIEKSDE